MMPLGVTAAAVADPTVLLAAALDTGTVVADAALLLLVGGLTMLCVIMLLVGIQNLIPERTPIGPIGPGGSAPRNEPLPRLWPRRPKKVASGLPVDVAMARIVHLRLGEPRILQARMHTTRVRLYGCPGCAVDSAKPTTGCVVERAGVERAFKETYTGRVTAWEIACRRRGDEACDFEVRH